MRRLILIIGILVATGCGATGIRMREAAVDGLPQLFSTAANNPSPGGLVGAGLAYLLHVGGAAFIAGGTVHLAHKHGQRKRKTSGGGPGKMDPLSS